MIRQDYLLRMVDLCLQALQRSLRLTHEGEFDAARGELDQSVRDLTGLTVDEVLRMSEAELTALLVQGGPTQVLRQKGMLLVALIRRAGENFAAQARVLESRTCDVKALNLELQILAREGSFDFPEFVPRVDELVAAVGSEHLPLETALALLQYYEREGDYAKGENVLFALVDAHPDQPVLQVIGNQFYERLLRQDDEALVRGNLPRDEVEAGSADFRRRFEPEA